MIESTVDLAYRGLPLARQVKLTSVRPREAYVEVPAPMPVGTALRLTTDDGLELDARVVGVTEQTGGPNGGPGMQIAPVLEGAGAQWWSARVALPDAPVTPRRLVIQPTTPVAVAPAPAAPAAPILPTKTTTAPMRSVAASADPMDGATMPMPILDDVPEVPEPIDDGSDDDTRTTLMQAAIPDDLGPSTSPPVIVDDGKQTQVMEAVDLSALGLDSSSSGSMRMITQSDDDDSKPTAAGKKRRKRR